MRWRKRSSGVVSFGALASCLLVAAPARATSDRNASFAATHVDAAPSTSDLTAAP